MHKYGSDNFTYYDYGNLGAGSTYITIRSFNEVVAIALMELCDKCFDENALSKANTSINIISKRKVAKNGIKLNFLQNELTV